MAMREAEAHGARGDKTEMNHAISRAFRAHESTRGFDPAWVYLPDAEISGVSGKAHMWLGDYPSAVAHLQDATNSSAAWPRERASWQLHLASNLIKSGDISHACAVLTDTLSTVSDLASARLQKRLDRTVAALRPYTKVPEARELLGMWAAQV
ncbi:hypothetical protein ACWDNI_34645 [Nocardia niigatensis]